MEIITMNSKIKVEMTLTEAHLLRSHLFIEKFENKTDTGKEVVENLLKRVDEALNKLNFSENEIIVDKINKEIENKA